VHKTVRGLQVGAAEPEQLSPLQPHLLANFRLPMSAVSFASAKRQREIETVRLDGQLGTEKFGFLLSLIGSAYAKLFNAARRAADRDGEDFDALDLRDDACQIDPSALHPAARAKFAALFGAAKLTVDYDGTIDVRKSMRDNSVEHVSFHSDRFNRVVPASDLFLSAPAPQADEKHVLLRTKIGKGAYLDTWVPASVAAFHS
jgi:hypothetical protein